jgi:hypothetical protein
MRRSRWYLLPLALVALLVLAACGSDMSATVPEEALISPSITNGELDGDGHPHVGLMVALVNGTPAWRCSGTLISPTVFLTAGHCTYGATSVEIWFQPDVESNRTLYGYPGGSPTYSVSGEPITYPEYDNAAFFLADVGVVILAEEDAVDDLKVYGVLPEEDQLDALAKRRGKQITTFTSVGYGLQRINPVFVEAELVRMVATPHLIQINAPGFTGDFSLLLSNNHATGGTCFGDSGGPNFLGDSNVVAGVTSFGINGNCAGTGGVFRMDRKGPLEWVQGFLD